MPSAGSISALARIFTAADMVAKSPSLASLGFPRMFMRAGIVSLYFFNGMVYRVSIRKLGVCFGRAKPAQNTPPPNLRLGPKYIVLKIQQFLDAGSRQVQQLIEDGTRERGAFGSALNFDEIAS